MSGASAGNAICGIAFAPFATYAFLAEETKHLTAVHIDDSGGFRSIQPGQAEHGLRQVGWTQPDVREREIVGNGTTLYPPSKGKDGASKPIVCARNPLHSSDRTPGSDDDRRVSVPS